MNNFEVEQLKRAGYEVKVFSMFHWEVHKNGVTKVVSIWPTARKILVKYERGPAPRFQGSIVAAVDRLFQKYKPPPIYTPEQLELMHFIWEYRERPLEVIKELIDA